MEAALKYIDKEISEAKVTVTLTHALQQIWAS